jgi:hypothetical protein
MSQQPTSVGDNFKLKELSDLSININAYYNGFINIDSVEPSLGLPSANTFTSPNSTYYFPVITSNPFYRNSRKFTNNGNLLVVSGNKIGIGTSSPNSKLTVVGDISARNGRLYADDLPYTMVFSNSSIKATQGNNTIYDNLSGTPLYSNINGGCLNEINASMGSVIAGGESNYIDYSDDSTISGGYSNSILGGIGAIIAGGVCNTNSGYCISTIVGGKCNIIEYYGACSVIVGGFCNSLVSHAEAATIIGGGRNKITAEEGPGDYPEADELTNDESYSFIGGGEANSTIEIYSTIVGGCENTTLSSGSRYKRR